MASLAFLISFVCSSCKRMVVVGQLKTIQQVHWAMHPSSRCHQERTCGSVASAHRQETGAPDLEVALGEAKGVKDAACAHMLSSAPDRNTCSSCLY